MGWSIGTLTGAARAAVALALLLPAGAAWADSTSPTPTPPQITEIGGKKFKDWLADLKHSDPSVREEAVRAIVLFPNANEAVPALIDRLADNDASPRIKAVLALGMIKIDEKDIPKVVDALGARLTNDSQAPIRYDAAVTLGGMAKDARSAVPALLHGVEDPSSFEIRRVCISVVAQAGQTPDKGPDPRVTRALMGALDDRASQVRLQAVEGLAQMGKPADSDLLIREVAAVRNMMKDRDKTVVIWAHLSMMGLDKIDDPDIDYLTQNAKPGEIDRLRVQAIGALGIVGAKDKKVVPTLVDLLSEKANSAVVNAACQALGGIGDPGDKAEKALADVCKDATFEEQVRFQAMYALAAIGPRGKTAVPTLIELLADKDPNVVQTACHALGCMEEPGGAAEQALTNLANSKDVSDSIRKYAQQILATLAKPKKP